MSDVIRPPCAALKFGMMYVQYSYQSVFTDSFFWRTVRLGNSPTESRTADRTQTFDFDAQDLLSAEGPGE